MKIDTKNKVIKNGKKYMIPKSYIFPTEHELKETNSSYRLFSHHRKDVDKRIGLIDKQDGVIYHWSNVKIKITKKIINDISKAIEKWMEEDPNGKDNRIEISVQTGKNDSYSIGFEKYIVNFQHCANGCDQWMIVKCSLRGWPKIYSKHLGCFLLNDNKGDLHFVHNQVFNMSNQYECDYKKETSFFDKIDVSKEG